MIAAGGCNLGCHAAVAGGALYYGSGPNVLRRDIATGHTELALRTDSPVKYVRWAGEGMLVGCSSGSIYHGDQLFHAGSAVSALAESRSVVYAAGAESGRVLAWRPEQQVVHSFSPRKVTALHAFSVDSTTVLAVATSDSVVTLLVLDADLRITDRVVLDGHLNWITSMDTLAGEHGVTLATGSLDRNIRLWTLSSGEAAGEGLSELVPKKRRLLVANRVFSVAPTGLLFGHEGGVQHVHFDRGMLVSAAADRSVILWDPATAEQSAQVGDTSGGQLGASVGADHSTGYYWAAVHGDVLLAGQSGGTVQAFDLVLQRWRPPIVTGHLGSVESVAWLSADMLLSAGHDQTSRIWHVGNGAMVEVSRVQIHGYDINAVAPFGEGFASAADEKVVRLFVRPPADWADRVACLRGGIERLRVRPARTVVPVLGLTNKQESGELEGSEKDGGELESGGRFPETALAVPLETDLARWTLWPETGKLYGHGNEVYRVATADDAALLASSCKATRAEDARVRLWKDGRCVAVLGDGPTLTATSLTFSEQQLLVTSRDRSWRIYDCLTETLVCKRGDAHSRAILGAAWLTRDTFVTVGRDKAVRRWHCSGALLGSVEVPACATAAGRAESAVLVGLEDGRLLFLDDDLSVLRSVQLGASAINDIRCRDNRIAVASSDGSVYVVCNK